MNTNPIETDKSEDSKMKIKESQKIKAEKYKSENIIEERVGEEEEMSLIQQNSSKNNNNSEIEKDEKSKSGKKSDEENSIKTGNNKNNKNSSIGGNIVNESNIINENSSFSSENHRNLNLKDKEKEEANPSSNSNFLTQNQLNKENATIEAELSKNPMETKLLNTVLTLNTSGSKFEKYLIDNLIPNAFSKIFSELITKEINKEDYFAYTAARLNEIHKEVSSLSNEYDFSGK